jgi:hypothetical protein
MHGLEITRNGRRTIVAGGDAIISLSAVMAVYGKLGQNTQNEAPPFGNLTVLGVAAAEGDNKQKMITWNEKRDLKLGDEITIRFIEIKKPSKPSEVTEIAPDENE